MQFMLHEALDGHKQTDLNFGKFVERWRLATKPKIICLFLCLFVGWFLFTF